MLPKLQIMNTVIVFVICFSTVIKIAASITAECKFGIFGSFLIGPVYSCINENQLNIEVIENRTIDKVIGTHLESKTNIDVINFFANEKKALYFPKGLEKFFKNLQRISIERSQMKEIKQADLKPFPELKELIIQYSNIEVLEDGLFDFNPHLKLISFWGAKIFHIDQNVFNNLKDLTDLWLNSNKCFNDWAKDNSSDMQAFISNVKDNCYNLDFVEVRKNLNELENDIKTLGHDNYKDFLVKFDSSETKFKSSKFSHYLLFKDKFQSIRTDPKYVEFFNFHSLEKRIEKLNSGQNKIKENVDKCSNVCHSSILTNIQNLDRTLKFNIISVALLKQNVDNINNKVTNSESDMKNRVEKIENSLGEVDSKTSLMIDQKIAEFKGKLNDFEPESVKNMKTKITELSNFTIDLENLYEKFNSFEIKTTGRVKMLEDGLSRVDSNINVKIDHKLAEFKDSNNIIENKVVQLEVQTKTKIDQILGDIERCTKLQTESTFLTNKKFDKTDKRIEKVEGEVMGKLKVVENKLDEIISMPKIDQSESLLSNFKNETMINLDKHKNDVNIKTVALMRKIDVLIKRIEQLEKEVEVLKGK